MILYVLLKGFVRRRFKILLTVFSISVGVLSVIIISTVGLVGKKYIKQQLASLGLGEIFITPLYPDSPYLLSDNEISVIESCTGVKNACPLMFRTSLVNINNEYQNCITFGIDENFCDVMQLPLVYGRNICKLDTESFDNVCIVDTMLSEKLFSRKNIVGKKIRLNISGTEEEYKVIGVVTSFDGMVNNLVSQYASNFVYLPCTVLKKSLCTDSYDSVAVSLENGQKSGEVENAICEKLNLYSGIGGAYKSENMLKHSDTLEKIMNTVLIILSLVAGVSLVVSSMSVMATMISSVKERTKEIGIKKSLGATPKNILLEFLSEGILLCLIGFFAGMLFALAISFIICKIIGIGFYVNLSSILICLAATLLFGTIFAVYPAVCASKLKVVDALRYE